MRGVRWPAPRGVGGALAPEVAVGLGGGRGSGHLPGVGGVRRVPGALGAGPCRLACVPASHAPRTGADRAKGSLSQTHLCHGEAAHRQRSASRCQMMRHRGLPG